MFDLDKLDGDALDAAAEAAERVPDRVLRIIRTSQLLAGDERTAPAVRGEARKKADELIKKYRVPPALLATLVLIFTVFF